MTPEQEHLLESIKTMQSDFVRHMRRERTFEGRQIYAIGTSLAALTIIAESMPPELKEAIIDLRILCDRAMLDEPLT